MDLLKIFLCYCLAIMLMLSACSEEIKINADYEDIWVVYGVLNLEDSLQYIRVSKVFQIQEDAVAYASQNDPTIKGLTITVEGAGKTWQATPAINAARDSDGDFPKEMNLYQLETFGQDALLSGELYTLTITSDSLPGFRLNAQTRMPPRPKISSPDIITKSFSEYCLPEVQFEDSVEVFFEKEASSSRENKAMRFEVRVKLEYTENGEPKELIYHPSRLLAHSFGCRSGNNAILCYQFPTRGVINFFSSRLNSPDATYAYQATPACASAPAYVSKGVSLEVAAIDTILSRYILTNDPRFFNINTIRPEYSNMKGTERAIGIFGSVATDDQPVGITECAEYLLRLNDKTDRPIDCE